MRMRTYRTYNCELSILNDKEITYEDDMGRVARGEVRLNDLTQMTVKRLERWVKECEDRCEQSDLILLGRHLYEVLFDKGKSEANYSDSVRKAFEDTYNYFKSEVRVNPDLRLRVVLAFHEEATELVKLPWEFMYIPALPNGFFLAGQETTLILTRYVPVVETDKFRATKERGSLPEVKQLRIFLLYCQPKGYPTVEAEKVITEIRKLGKNADEVLRNHPGGATEQEEEGGIIIRFRQDLTYESLRAELTEFKPHIFHFIGHGKPGHLFLIKDKDAIETEAAHLNISPEKVDQGDPRNSRDVSLLFTGYNPRLVFLESCSSAENIQSFEGLSSVARDLVRCGIPSVVAMQYPIENEEVSLFAKTVYEELGKGENIDEAVNVARKNLGEVNVNPTWSKRRFGTPVVYLQTEQRIVLPRPTFSQKLVACPGRRLPQLHYVFPTDPFCQQCGEALALCPKGHVMVKAGFCNECGLKPEPIVAETKAATVAPPKGNI